MTSTLPYPPAALPAKQAYEYVGGRNVFIALQREFPEHFQPIYKTTRYTAYLRKDLDNALKAAAQRNTPLTNPEE